MRIEHTVHPFFCYFSRVDVVQFVIFTRQLPKIEFCPFWIYSVCEKSNTSLDGSTYWQVFYPIVTKISTSVDRSLRRYSFENGVDRTHSSHATVALSLI